MACPLEKGRNEATQKFERAPEELFERVEDRPEEAR